MKLMINKFLGAFVFYLCIQMAYSQKAGIKVFSDADTSAVSESLKVDPSDAQLTEKEKQVVNDSLKKAAYAWQRFKEVLSVKKDVFWAEEMSAKMKAFQDSTFIQINAIAEVKDKGVLIGLVNRFGAITDDERAPYVRVIWSINPVTKQQMPFKLMVRIEKSNAIPDEVINSALKKMTPFYKDKSYSDINKAGPDITLAMDKLLEELAMKIGTSLAPTYLINADGVNYFNGEKAAILAGNDSDSLIYLKVYNRKEDIYLISGVTWIGAEEDGYGKAIVNKKFITQYHVKAIVEQEDTISVTVQVWDNDVRRQLEGLLFSMLSEVLDEILSSLQKDLIQKQQNLNDAKIRLQQEHEKNIEKRQEVQMDNLLVSNQAVSDNMQFISLSTTPVQQAAPPLENKAIIGSYKVEAAKYALLLSLVNFARLNQQALIDLMKPGNLNEFKNALSADIGKLSANVIVGLISGDKEGMKIYLMTSITNKLNQTTGR